MLENVDSREKSNRVWLSSLAEARDCDHAVAIMEGDWGGQIYLTCPVSMVHSSEQSLQKLLADIDAKCWACNEGRGKHLNFATFPIGSGVCGGMGGGEVLNGLWLHAELVKLGIQPRIEAILAGQTERRIFELLDTVEP